MQDPESERLGFKLWLFPFPAQTYWVLVCKTRYILTTVLNYYENQTRYHGDESTWHRACSQNTIHTLLGDIEVTGKENKSSLLYPPYSLLPKRGRWGKKEKKVDDGRILLFWVTQIQNLDNSEWHSANQYFSLFSPTLSTKPSSWKAFGFFMLEYTFALTPLLVLGKKQKTTLQTVMRYLSTQFQCCNQVQITTKLRCYLWSNLQRDKVYVASS